MYYIKKIMITSEGKDGEKVKSELPLKPGLNIVYGPSNTGKTHVLDCIDFMLGGDAKRLYKKELKIIAVSMFIDSDGAELTMYRELAEETKSDIVVSSKVPGIAPGTYTANNQPTKEKETIGSLWLKLMGIHEEVKIIKQIEDAQWQRLTVRTFYHMFVINENRISGENSILKSGTTWTNNIPVPTITALIYLLTEKNYITPGEKQQTPKATVKIKRAAAKQIVDGSMEAIKEKESLGIQEEETLSAAEIQQEINNLLEEISAAEDSLKQTTQHDEEISELIIGLTKSISESTVLKGRYDALRTRYEADMRRLTFIAEADFHKGTLREMLEELDKVQLLIVDELSYLKMDRERESLFFQVIRHRYEKSSLIITTNLPMGRWDELFTGKLAATAILDRLVHHCHILSITGDSYRVKGSKQSVK